MALVTRLDELGLTTERASARQLAGGLLAGLAMAAILIMCGASASEGRIEVVAVTPGVLGMVAPATP